MAEQSGQQTERVAELVLSENAGAVVASVVSERRQRPGYVMTALTVPELVAAVLALGLWFVLFGGGSLLGTGCTGRSWQRHWHGN